MLGGCASIALLASIGSSLRGNDEAPLNLAYAPKLSSKPGVKTCGRTVGSAAPGA